MIILLVVISLWSFTLGCVCSLNIPIYVAAATAMAAACSSERAWKLHALAQPLDSDICFIASACSSIGPQWSNNQTRLL